MRKKVVRWEVIRLRAKGEFIGTVQAKDKESARKVAVKEFSLPPGEEQRLIVRPA